MYKSVTPGTVVPPDHSSYQTELQGSEGRSDSEDSYMDMGKSDCLQHLSGQERVISKNLDFGKC